MSVNINHLPESVLLKIFSILGSERLCNLFRLRLVCQRWKTLASDCSLWRNISFHGNKHFDIAVLKRLVSWCSSIKEIDLSCCAKLDDPCLEVIAENCHKLEVLRVENCSVTDVGVYKLSKFCPRLRKLTLTHRGDKSLSSFALVELMKNCSNLEEVFIFFDDEDVNNILQCDNTFFISEVMANKMINGNMTRFYCKNASLHPEIMSQENAYTDSLFHKTLVEIGLPMCMDLTNLMLYNIGCSCPNLRSLDVSHCPGITDVGMIALAKFCPLLNDVNVMACRSITDITVQCLAKTCQNLQSLCVAGSELPQPMGNITDVAIKSIANECQNLCKLDVKWCQGVTDVGISTIATNCPNLTSLNVSGCLAITDVSMLVVAAYSKNLESLNITECLRITSSSVNAIAQNCTKLQYLDMQVCSYISDLDFRSDICCHLPLQHIDLAYCTKLTDNCIKCITCICNNLRYISLAGCRHVTDAGVKYISQNCPLLSYFDMSFRGSQSNTHLSSDSLVALANKCHMLVYVDLIGCWMITEECIKTFIGQCSYLGQLSVSQLSDQESTCDQRQCLVDIVSQYRVFCNIDRVSQSTRNGKLAESFIINMSSQVL